MQIVFELALPKRTRLCENLRDVQLHAHQQTVRCGNVEMLMCNGRKVAVRRSCEILGLRLQPLFAAADAVRGGAHTRSQQ